MKCKKCGKEIVVDEQTKIGVCVGCGKKFVISTIATAKVCRECKCDLVNKGAFWECPKCGKKYSFVNNKKDENSNVVVKTKLTTESESNGKTTIVETRKESNLKKSSLGESVDIDIGEYRVYLKTTSVQKKNAPSDDVIPPIKDDENDYIIPPTVEPQDDYIIPTKDSQNDVLEDDLIDDVEVSPKSSMKKDNLSQKENPSPKIENTSASSVSSTTSNPPKKEESSAVPTKKKEANVQKNQEPQKETTLTEPELHDVNENSSKGGENLNQSPAVSTIATQSRKAKSDSRGLSVLCKIAGIIFGILIVLLGIACYVTSHFDLVQKIAEVKIDSILPTLQMASTYAFFGLFALMMLFATLKHIRFKKIGTIISLISPILLAMTVLFGSELTKAHLDTYAIYAGYAILVFGSFLTMVITCKTDLSKAATVMGLVLFIFSILSLLVVALQLVPLKALKLNSLEPYVQYFKDVDKVLLGFASISTAVLIAKSE